MDETNRVIIMPPNFQYDHVMFEFISAPQKTDDYLVLTSMQEAVIAFIEWKMKIAPRELYYAAAIIARRRMPNKMYITTNKYHCKEGWDETSFLNNKMATIRICFRSR